MSFLLLLLIFQFFKTFAIYNCPTQMTKEKITIPFTGETYCGICGGEFSCTDSTNWNNGLKSFLSPVSPEYKVWSSFGQLFFQHDDCNSNSNITVKINGFF
jgi:hypothetical protein